MWPNEKGSWKTSEFISDDFKMLEYVHPANTFWLLFYFSNLELETTGSTLLFTLETTLFKWINVFMCGFFFLSWQFSLNYFCCRSTHQETFFFFSWNLVPHIKNKPKKEFSWKGKQYSPGSTQTRQNMCSAALHHWTIIRTAIKTTQRWLSLYSPK